MESKIGLVQPQTTNLGADEQGVALAEHGRQHLLDDLFLPDDHLAELRPHHPVGAGELLDGFQVVAGWLGGPPLRSPCTPGIPVRGCGWLGHGGTVS